jgi:pimeloyl-ACP methyl ester carboxylesterase
MDSNTTDKPTIVLVHGAFAESSSWNGVISRLVAQGFATIALANPLRGVRYDSDYLGSVLDDIEGDVVLVGHSYGGLITSTAGTGRDKVKGLVFVGAFAPEEGESGAQLSGRFEGSTLAPTLHAVKLPDGDVDLYIDQDKYRAQFTAESSAEDAATMAATQRPITESALNEPAGPPAWRAIPSWFVFGSDDKNIPVAAHRFMAERAGSRRTVEVAGGTHTVGIPEAATVVELISEAAGTTT